MSQPPFTMSKYATKEDLLKDKCAWLEQQLAEAQARIKGLEEFAMKCSEAETSFESLDKIRSNAKALSTTSPTEALDKVVREAVASKQAEIDRLMMEFCPDEMTPEQVENWKQHQQPIRRKNEKELTTIIPSSA